MVDTIGNRSLINELSIGGFTGMGYNLIIDLLHVGGILFLDQRFPYQKASLRLKSEYLVDGRPIWAKPGKLVNESMLLILLFLLFLPFQ